MVGAIGAHDPAGRPVGNPDIPLENTVPVEVADTDPFSFGIHGIILPQRDAGMNNNHFN
jgi:hypothetical protein